MINYCLKANGERMLRLKMDGGFFATAPEGYMTRINEQA
jgi:hypothetical protein